MEKFITVPSKRGRPKKELIDLQKELKKIQKVENDENKVKVVKNNIASKIYRIKKNQIRAKLDQKLWKEIELFKKLQKTHTDLEKEISLLKCLIE